MPLKLSEEEAGLLDETAKDLFSKRLYNMRDMSEPEMKKIGTDCYKKALCLIEARREFLEMLQV